jgi:hypothetical protein
VEDPILTSYHAYHGSTEQLSARVACFWQFSGMHCATNYQMWSGVMMAFLMAAPSLWYLRHSTVALVRSHLCFNAVK